MGHSILTDFFFDEVRMVLEKTNYLALLVVNAKSKAYVIVICLH